MCATYVIKAHRDFLRKRYGLSLPDDFEGIDERIVPFKSAPILVAKKDDKTQMELRRMQFSLIPPWSKELKPKFATFNARVEDIETKPTWKDSFKKRHCVVPITSFIEPIYTGAHAGHMVAFNATDILSAAGIYNYWINPATGEEVGSFAIVMTEALPFVKNIGHSRSPFFIEGAAATQWLYFENDDSQKMKSFLFENRASPELDVTLDRPMAKGWEKRIPQGDE